MADMPIKDDDTLTWPRPVRRHVHAPEHAWFAACAPGLEDMLADEARETDLHEVQPIPGGVAFRGRLADGYAANLRLRLANRVLVRVAEFTARAPEDVVRECRGVPWEAWLPIDVPLRIDVTVRDSRMASSGLLKTKAMDGIRDRMNAAGAPMPPAVEHAQNDARPAVEDDDAQDVQGPPQRLMIRLQSNRMTISLDSSGEHLHRRGYRIATTAAPIRETLAAAILRFAGYDGSIPLVDPMCGSGTFPIEAAWMATGTPPGAARSFAFQRWPSYRPATWEWLLRKSLAARVAPVSTILGADRDDNALKAARTNAGRAGVTGDVSFLHRDFEVLGPVDAGADRGLLIMNPPYGLRLGSGEDPATIFHAIGRRLATAWRGWRFGIVLPDQGLTRAIGLPFDDMLRLPHGGLAIAVVRGRVP